MNFMKHAEIMFKRFSNLEESEYSINIKSIMNNPEVDALIQKTLNEMNVGESKVNMVLGNPINVDNKVLHPIIQTSAIITGKKSFLTWIEPIAIVMEETGEKYVFFLTEVEIDPQKLIEMVSSKE